MKKLTLQEALVEAIKEEMRRDERVFHMGQDIGIFGGSMQSTDSGQSPPGEDVRAR